jgi:arylformamidase
MQIELEYHHQKYTANLDHSTDLSMPLLAGLDTVNCFYAPLVTYEPVRMGDFVGSTAEGGVVNFFNIKINPHGNGTHTECVGHISKERYVIGDCLKKYHFFAKLISVYPQKMDNGDRVVLLERIQEQLQAGEVEALIIRTLPNDDQKKRTHYSGTNPVYFHPEAIAYMVECGIQHLLIDLPSVDREEDGGQLAAHKAFWQYPSDQVRTGATITELIYVPDSVQDGNYLLNIQTANFDLDASPSKIIIFPIEVI